MSRPRSAARRLAVSINGAAKSIPTTSAPSAAASSARSPVPHAMSSQCFPFAGPSASTTPRWTSPIVWEISSKGALPHTKLCRSLSASNAILRLPSLAAGPQHEQVLTRVLDLVPDTLVRLEEVDPRAMQLLAALVVEGLRQRLRRAVARHEQLPVVLTARGSHHRHVLLDVQVVRAAEQFVDAVPLAPLEGALHALGRRRLERLHDLEQLADPALGCPVDHGQPSAGTDDARELGGRGLLVRCEHHAARRGDDVEAPGLDVHEVLAVADAEIDLEALLRRLALGGLDQCR